MFPIRDHNPSQSTPFVTWALIAANLLIFLLYFPQLSGNEVELAAFYREWGLVPARFLGGEATITVLSSMFLHGGWLHLIGNLVFLWIFGDNLEDLMGHGGFALFYGLSGVAAAAGQVFADPQSPIPMVGASGAIAGVMGGYLLMFPKARIDVAVFLVIIFKVFTVPAWLLLGLWFALQISSGLSVGVTGGAEVAYWAHAAGFAAGIILTLPLWLRRGGPRLWAAFGGRPPHPELVYQIERRGRISVPKVRRTRRPVEPSNRALADVSRVPRSGTRRRPSGPWSGGR